MDSNPFQSPQAPRPDFDVAPGFDPRVVGRARQVPVVAALLVANGVLLCVIGIGYIALATFVTNQLIDQVVAQEKLQGRDGAFPPAVRWIVFGTWAGLGALGLVDGLVGIVAGIRNYRYRGRTLGIVALIGGLGTILFFWLMPLSIALLIYGLIIYMSQDGSRAFRWQQAHDQAGGA
jgi:hypothetical protein